MSEILYRLKRYPRILIELITGNAGAFHIRCGSAISFRQVTSGYYAQCPECFEDLYSFEVEESK